MSELGIISHGSEHRELSRANRYAASVVFNIIDRIVNIDSVLDLGCGTGVWMQAALRKQNRKVFGVDVEEFRAEELFVPSNLIVNASLAKKLDLRERFDLVLCLETAEHLAPESAVNIVENCVRHSDLVLFSAALPGQGGLNHLNEQPPEYWADIFQQSNYEVIDLIRPSVWDDELVPAWYRQNMLIYVKRERTDLVASLRKEAAGFPTHLTRFHPDIVRMNVMRAQLREAESKRVADEIANELAHARSLCEELQQANEQLRVESQQFRSRLSQAEVALEEREFERAAILEQAKAEGLRGQGTQHQLAVTARERLDLSRKLDSANHQLATISDELARATQNVADIDSHTANLRQSVFDLVQRYRELRDFSQVAQDQVRVIYQSTSWRLSAPARFASASMRKLAGRPATIGFEPAIFNNGNGFDDTELERIINANKPLVLANSSSDLTSSFQHEMASASRIPRTVVTFISGEPDTPGHHYRIENMQRALPKLYYDVLVVSASEVHDRASEIAHSNVVWIWRTAWSNRLASFIDLARARGGKVIFDIDDLMFKPDLAIASEIDGIRSQGFAEQDIAAFYAQINKMLQQADLCVTTTLRLAREIIQAGKPAAIIPNGYAFGALQVAAEAVKSVEEAHSDEVIRIGYAAGSRTHQKDFSLVASAIAEVLAAVPHARLVLTKGTVDVSEFPVLKAVARQIEWRDFVPLGQMLFEYARYTINIVPLEIGNRYCEAKSELKFFEAALVGVPTIASPTEPYAAAIRHGETGFLAANSDEWRHAISLLVSDAAVRRRVAAAARREVLWNYGPERRAFAVRRTIGRVLAEPAVAAGLFQAQIDDDICRPLAEIKVTEHSVVFENDAGGYSRVAVVMPCFNYANYIVEALDTVLNQTLKKIDLVIVDDCSTDESLVKAKDWLVKNMSSFNRVALLKNKVNSKLGASRNVAINHAQTELFFPLDPDNLLLPDCIERCLEVIDATGAAVAYPKIESYGDTGGQTWYLSEPPWQPDRFRSGNYIDAMALIRTSCWAAVGGYVPFMYGWEDYDLWCRFVEHGFFGTNVPEVTALYRYHGNQMIKTLTQKSSVPLLSEMQSRHPWTYPVQ